MSESLIHFCPHCGSKLKKQVAFGESRPACPACGRIYYADPKVAVVALIEQDGQVLLARRVNEPFQNSWTFPGGFVNAFEDPKLALQREVLEETNLEVRITTLVDVLSGREHPRGADILIVYQAVITGGRLRAGDDASEVGFFARDRLPLLAFQSTVKILNEKWPQ